MTNTLTLATAFVTLQHAISHYVHSLSSTANIMEDEIYNVLDKARIELKAEIHDNVLRDVWKASHLMDNVLLLCDNRSFREYVRMHA